MVKTLRSFVKYCFHHSKIKFISSSHRVISSIYFTAVGFASFHSFIWFISKLEICESADSFARPRCAQGKATRERSFVIISVEPKDPDSM